LRFIVLVVSNIQKMIKITVSEFSHDLFKK
jgi:hypothetical protein